MPNPLGCKNPSPNGTCTECLDSYIVTADQTCDKKPENCLTYDVQTMKCTSCVDTFEYNAKMDKCIKAPGHCDDVDQDTLKCTKCEVGWGLDADSACFPCPVNAVSCDLQNIVCEEKRYFEETGYQCLPCHGSCNKCATNTG
jgi:hypothetical protein